jgi:hypothetical protein
MEYIPESVIPAFWDNVQKGPLEDDCWLWTGAKRGNGYGCLRIPYNGVWKTYYTHRISWVLHYGPIKDGMKICHGECNNPSCVNPRHLWEGTQKENLEDMDRKGRRVSTKVKGEEHYNHKLTTEQVLEIRELWKTGKFFYNDLAKIFKVSTNCIGSIIRRDTWEHI